MEKVGVLKISEVYFADKEQISPCMLRASQPLPQPFPHSFSVREDQKVVGSIHDIQAGIASGMADPAHHDLRTPQSDTGILASVEQSHGK